MKLETSLHRLRNCLQNLVCGLALAALSAGLPAPAFADTHKLPIVGGQPESWSVWARIEGQDVKFHQEGESGAIGDGHRVLLYTAPKEAAVAVYADFHGALPAGVEAISQTIEMFGETVAVWTIDGGGLPPSSI